MFHTSAMFKSVRIVVTKSGSKFRNSVDFIEFDVIGGDELRRVSSSIDDRRRVGVAGRRDIIFFAGEEE